jgi:putative transcriptional regulator
MIGRLLFIALAVGLLPATAVADEAPAKGKLLVATELIRGDIFVHTVVLLLHYDETGAVGLVNNRPTDVEPRELLTDDDHIASYDGTLYWGGPVEMDSVRALVRSNAPPQSAERITGSVYMVPFDDALSEIPGGTAHLRFFIGIAGWAPGQLELELAAGSWTVVPATDDRIFAKDSATLWHRLAPRQERRAATAGTEADLLTALTGDIR